MVMKCLLILLCVVYKIQCAVTTTQTPEYPCNEQILFGFENSLTVNSFIFQRQMSFLLNHVFEQWTHFDQLALIRYADCDFQNFGYFDSMFSIRPIYSICGSFLQMSSYGVQNSKIILLASEFYWYDVIDACILTLKTLISAGNEFVFIPLSNQFNTTVLKQYFKQAKIIKWDVVNSEAPDDWEEQFNKIYNCGDIKTTSIVKYSSATTENPITPHPPCDIQVVIAFDKSTRFSSQEYQGIQNFLIDRVFKNWTRFGQQLDFYSFANYVYSTAVPFENTADLEEFIRNEEQIVSDPNFCDFFYNAFTNYDLSKNHGVIFLSKFNKEELESINPQDETCKEMLAISLHVQLTFVILNNAVDIDALREYTPQAQFIKLNLSNVSSNWEWQFNTAYGCNQDDYNDRTAHPCDSKFIFAYEMDKTIIDAQSSFLKEHVFNSDWNVFNNLALIAYSNNTQIQDFGTLKSINDIHSFIDESTKQNNYPVSLCSVFEQLTTMYLKDVNIILFVNQFHETVGDECPFLIKQVRENVKTINFVVLSKYVNTEYLASKFPQAIFTSWDTTKEMPGNWTIESFGCQNFVVNGTYPCYNALTNNIVVYDRSNNLSPIAYQNLEYFLLMRVFIKQWLSTKSVEVYSYPEDGHSIAPKKIELELFIRQNLKETRAAAYETSTSNLLFFVSKFDKDVFEMDKACNESVNEINKAAKITFIKLKLFDDTLLRRFFPNATIIEWNIEQDRELARWNQIVWTAFGCSGNSSIILPSTDTSTYAYPTTRSLTTTTAARKASTMLELSTQKKVTTSSTAAPSTRIITTHSSSSKPPVALIVILSTLIPLFVVCVTAGISGFCWYRRRKRGQIIGNMAFDAVGETSNAYNGRRNEEDLWKLNPENVKFFANKKLGSGISANVFLGKLTGDAGIKKVYPDLIALRHFHDCKVAIKMLPFYATELNKEDFKQEINFMKVLKYHPHILCMLGYTNEQIILEYCANGDLIRFLNRNKTDFTNGNEGSLKPKDLVSFSWQIANGMEYFSSLSFVHRDLAARNVLLTRGNVCKISDFGLSRANNMQFYTSKKRLPVRWLPPEALKSFEYSAKTDVWSYGVLLYEIFTLGSFPYLELENSEILSHIEGGNRLPHPEHASDEIYSIMLTCWTSASNQRPTFTQICQKLIPILDVFNISYNYVNPIEEEINELAVFDDYFNDDSSV